MHEVTCPHCGEKFAIDEAGYADIAKQVRDAEFDAQLHERLELAERDKQSAVKLAEANASAELEKSAAAKEAEIQALKAKLEAGETEKQLAINDAKSTVE